MNVCRDTVQRERVQETVSGIHTRVVFGCGELVISLLILLEVKQTALLT